MGKYTNEQIREMRAIIENQMQGADDATAVKATMLYPHWKPEATYAVGYRVQYNGKLYSVLQAHESQETWPPDITASLYAPVLVPDDGSIPEWVQPESTNGYSKGDKVTHNGVTYESLVDNNVWEPGVVGSEALWMEVNDDE